MEDFLSDLITISQYFGGKKDYAIAGGGNTSYKNDTTLWVKASGVPMKNITPEGFVPLSRQLLKIIYTRQYSKVSLMREEEVKKDLLNACIGNQDARPSVETSLHDLINYTWVVHTHPTLLNGITCSALAKETIHELFGEQVLYIPYTDPGYILFDTVRNSLNLWRESHKDDPKIIFLQNHGVFVAANKTEEVKEIYSFLESAAKKVIHQYPDMTPENIPDHIIDVLPALRMILSKDSIKLARIRNHRLAEYFTASQKQFEQVSLPFTPDQIVYCKARPVYLESETSADLISECISKTETFERKYGYLPKVIGIKGFGIVAFEDNIRGVETVLDVFDDWMKISFLSQNFGGTHFMDESSITFIDNWEVENYRRKLLQAATARRKAENKIVIITGGAQGFGEGIAQSMLKEGANVVIADINEGKGNELTALMNESTAQNEAISIKTDVTHEGSVKKLMVETVKQFGGIDVFISNAGILKAGGLDEITPETFERITKVNYTGYFLCTRYASSVMKLQASYAGNYYTDIIQINSKSGLKGSNRNFAYAGSKFGGIGLTQSFAMELIPWRIKVNAICPGNFFDGPLWSDPETGLFVQYLKTGKVEGAETINDVREYYNKQVPAGRGCRIDDVMKALFYIIEQEYETGQAIPVTGGQEMLR